MTPAARISAAIDILDSILAGEPAEKALTNWARASRFAGSGDRAAVRDHVFEALRCRRSYGWLGGGADGRALMIGALHASNTDPESLFSGEKYAPAPLTSEERARRELRDAPRAVRLDVPDWLLAHLERALGADCTPVLQALRQRAPLFLRVNRLRAQMDEAIRALARDGIEARPHPLAETALEVLRNPRRVRGSSAWRRGLVEIQDAASQAVVGALPLRDGMRVLDYCAGGGGKALAMAARARLALTAHDANPGRMRDLPARAARAGAEVAIATQAQLAGRRFDLVVCDVPCSGSGAWRRSPEAKWRLSPKRLQELNEIQKSILRNASEHVDEKGRIAYITCSLLDEENGQVVSHFIQNTPGWRVKMQRRFTPLDGGADGFFLAVLTRATVKS